MTKRLGVPLRYGIVLGVVAGCVSSLSQILPQRYLTYRMYNTAFRSAALALDINLAVMIIVSLLTAGLWWSSASLSRATRTACKTAGILAILVFLAWKSGVVGTLGDSDVRGKYVELISQTKWHLLAAICCAVLGGYTLKRMHRAEPAGLKNGSSGKSKGKNAGRGKSPSLGEHTSTPHSGGLAHFVGHRNHVAGTALAVLLALNITALFFAAGTAASVRHKPNIVFVMFDTCRADHLGCYNHDPNASPNIDEFAGGAIRFDRAISQASITTASVGSFLTSRYPQSIILENAHGVPGVPRYLPTLAEVLKDQGYCTSAVVSNILAQAALGFDHGFDYFNEELKFTDVTSPGVLSLSLKRLNNQRRKPFFMFLLFMDPHTPYIKHAEYGGYPGYKGKLGDRVEVTDADAEDAAHVFTANDVEYMRALYRGEIKYTDAYFGLLLKELKKRNLYDDTLIVFLGDHGEEFMEHGLLLHGHTVYDEATHVPLIVKLPRQSRGKVIHGVFPLINLFPSIIKYTGGDPTSTQPHGKAVDLNGLTSAPSDRVFTAEDTRFGKIWAVQDNKYKLIWNTTTGDIRLFDMVTDPSEKTNIAGREPDVLSSFLKAAKEKEDMVGWEAGNNGKIGLSPQVFSDMERERLKSLGYAQ